MRFIVNGKDISDEIKTVIEVYINPYEYVKKFIHYKPDADERVIDNIRRELPSKFRLHKRTLILNDGYYERYDDDDIWYWVADLNEKKHN